MPSGAQRPRLRRDRAFGKSHDSHAAIRHGGEVAVAGQQNAFFGEAARDQRGVSDTALGDRGVVARRS
jgi:hypothetical protein